MLKYSKRRKNPHRQIFKTFSQFLNDLEKGVITPTLISKYNTVQVLSDDKLIQIFNNPKIAIEQKEIIVNFLLTEKNIAMTNAKKQLIYLGTPNGVGEWLSRIAGRLNKEVRENLFAHFASKRFSNDDLREMTINQEFNVELIIKVINSFPSFTTTLIDLCSDLEHVKKIYEPLLWVLYDKLMQNEPKIIPPYLKIFVYTKLFGHVLGLSKKIDYSISGEQFCVDPEGNYTWVSIRKLLHQMQRFNTIGKNANKFGPILEAFQFSFKYLRKYLCDYANFNDTTAIDFERRYKEGSLLPIFTGWEGHSVGVVLYGPFLVYCNRGEKGADSNNTSLYMVENPDLINMDWMKSVIKPFKNGEDLHEVLEKVVRLKKPIFQFPTKEQDSGTCSYVNPKGLIEAILALMTAYPTIKDMSPKAERFIQVAKSIDNRKEYKQFTRFIRDCEIDFLIEELKLEKDPISRELLIVLTVEILTAHHGENCRSERKKGQELERANKLLEGMPNDILTRLEQMPLLVGIINNIRMQFQSHVLLQSFLSKENERTTTNSMVDKLQFKNHKEQWRNALQYASKIGKNSQQKRTAVGKAGKNR